MERMRGSAAFTALTISSVEALPLRVMVMRTPRETVGADDVVLHAEAIMNLGHVLDIDGCAVHGFDRQVIEFVQFQGTAVDPDLIFGFAEFGGAGRQDEILQSKGVRDVDGRKLFRVKLIEVEIHHDGALLAAERIGNRRALHGAERGADEVVADIEDFLLAQGLAGKAELQDGNAGGIVFQNVGREHAGRHLADGRLHGGGDLRHRHIDFDVRMEVDADHRVSVIGLRFDVLDVVDVGGEAAFEAGDDALLHFLGREAVVGPKHADNGDVDIRKDIDRHSDNGGAAEDGDEDRHDDEGVRVA